MAKSIAQEEEEALQLGRHLLQIGGQEDTLKIIEGLVGGPGGVTPQILAQLDIKTSELRDGLRGAGTRDFTTLETDIEAILARLNVNLSTRASQTTLAAILTQLDVALSTRASETTLSNQLNITLSALRDAIRGPNTKNFSTLETDVEGILGDTPALNDETVKGLLRSLGDAGVAPTNAAGKTALKLLTDIFGQLNITLTAFRDGLRGANTKDFSTLEADLETVAGDTPALNDESVKGVLRTLGDAGAAPTNATGNTLLKLVDNVHSKLNTQLDITITALRDAIRGASTKDFTTLESDLEAVLGDTQALNDDSIKGLLRSLGDAGAAPTNATGNTLLKLVDLVYAKLNTQLDITFSSFRDALRGASTKDFTTLEADLEVVAGDTPALNDDSVKGLLRSLGDAGAAPTNVTGKTALKLLDEMLGQLNITLSAHRDALQGASTKDFSTLETDVEAVLADTQAINDDSIKGLLRSLGDAGAAPTNATGNTLLKLGDLIYGKLNTQLDITVSALRDAIRGAGTKDFSTLETELAKKVDGATTRATYTVTMTNPDQEYSQALPNNCLKFLIHTRDGTEFRIANVAGKVAGPAEPYFTIPANVPYWEDFIDPATMTLYFACASAGKIIELVVWS